VSSMTSARWVDDRLLWHARPGGTAIARRPPVRRTLTVTARLPNGATSTREMPYTTAVPPEDERVSSAFTRARRCTTVNNARGQYI
jgi:hypothetical protein